MVGRSRRRDNPRRDSCRGKCAKRERPSNSADSRSSATHPLRGDEMRALRKLQRESAPSPFVFTSERGVPFSTAGFAKLVERAGEAADFAFKAHPHMLRHACGFALANAGHDTRSLQAYLGHRNIQHTVRYTELAPDRFKDFWR
jgi:site-specific recombinase XerD